MDWQIEDRHGYLPVPRDIHVRYTDLTEAAEANLCEGWLMVHGHESADEAWINRVLVRRRASESLFVAVIEPYEDQSNIAAVRREGNRVHVELRDGRHDTFEWQADGPVKFSRDNLKLYP